MKVILFDLMDTLVEDPYHRMFDRDFPIALFRRWKDRLSFEEFERGEISEAEFFRRYYLPATPPEVRALLPKPRRLKKEMFRFIRPLPGMVELARALSARPLTSVGIASNYSEWYEHVLALRPELRSLARYLFFSCELGIRKPHPQYYERITAALRSAGAIGSAGQIVLIDDREVNVAAAREAGWVALRFSSAEETRGDLLSLLDTSPFSMDKNPSAEGA